MLGVSARRAVAVIVVNDHGREAGAARVLASLCPAGRELPPGSRAAKDGNVKVARSRLTDLGARFPGPVRFRPFVLVDLDLGGRRLVLVCGPLGASRVTAGRRHDG